jgi:hypothetical protein
VTLKVVASPRIVILTTLEVSFTLLENIYSTGITHDDCHDDRHDNHKRCIIQDTDVNGTKLFFVNGIVVNMGLFVSV